MTEETVMLASVLVGVVIYRFMYMILFHIIVSGKNVCMAECYIKNFVSCHRVMDVDIVVRRYWDGQ